MHRISLLFPVLLLASAMVYAQSAGQHAAASGYMSGIQTLNPDISAIIDVNYHADDSDDGIAHVMEEISGFGHVHPDGTEHHHGFDKGFNLRHLELQLSASVDPYFKGSAIAGIDTDSAEMEVAEVETTCLPWGFKLKAGKFFSDFGYINAQHSHQWDFTDQPLIYNLTLGDHGLNDKGAQLSWLAPTPFYLLAGVEAFQGDNEKMFAYSGEDPLPTHAGPRVWVGWVKFGPALTGRHAVQFGASAGAGKHQETHDGNDDGTSDHWLDGDSGFIGGDGVYKYNAPYAYGQGDFILQGEYFYRRKDLDLVRHELAPQLAGHSRANDQDGYYLQAVYGFLPRWRTGVRWEQVGLTNKSDLPDSTSESYGDSYRLGWMVDFSPTEFSRLRCQVNQGAYETDAGRENVVEAFAQLIVSLGTHGAHKF